MPASEGGHRSNLFSAKDPRDQPARTTQFFVQPDLFLPQPEPLTAPGAAVGAAFFSLQQPEPLTAPGAAVEAAFLLLQQPEPSTAPGAAVLSQEALEASLQAAFSEQALVVDTAPGAAVSVALLVWQPARQARRAAAANVATSFMSIAPRKQV